MSLFCRKGFRKRILQTVKKRNLKRTRLEFDLQDFLMRCQSQKVIFGSDQTELKLYSCATQWTSAVKDLWIQQDYE